MFWLAEIRAQIFGSSITSDGEDRLSFVFATQPVLTVSVDVARFGRVSES